MTPARRVSWPTSAPQPPEPIAAVRRPSPTTAAGPNREQADAASRRR